MQKFPPESNVRFWALWWACAEDDLHPFWVIPGLVGAEVE